jgi:hypothetical protein
VIVYVVCEYPHGQEDEIHAIKLVTTDPAEAKRAAQPDFRFFVEEFEVKT